MGTAPGWYGATACESNATSACQLQFARPLVVLAVGGRTYQTMKRRAAEQVIEQMPETTHHIEEYATEKLDLENLLAERMALMSKDQYEELLRPAFREDEKTVVAVGAVLGFIVGELQAALLL